MAQDLGRINVRISERERKILEEAKEEQGYTTDAEVVRWLLHQYDAWKEALVKIDAIYQQSVLSRG